MPSSSGGNPFEHMLGDLLRLLGQSGPSHWELARQLASSVAAEGEPDGNRDPIERIRIEELARVAEMHIREATGLEPFPASSGVRIALLSRAEWAAATLEAWQPLLESLSQSLAPPSPPSLGDLSLTQSQESLAGLLESLGRFMGPTILGLQLGSSIGHLARRALGQYDFPVPRAPKAEISLVPANLATFADAWSLDHDDVRMWSCVTELTHHGLFRIPNVTDRLTELLSTYVGGYRPDVSGIEEKLMGIDPTNIEALQAAMGDLGGSAREQESPVQTRAREQLEAVVGAVEGYVDYVTDTVGRRLVGSFSQLAEAFRRRRVERAGEELFVEQLFGLELSQAQFDRGGQFVRGIIEREGPEALSLLWESPGNLPTPNEIGAPGLWLERVRLPNEHPQP